MARQAISFGSSEQRSNALDGARLVNLYPEQPPLGSRAPSLQVGINTPIKSVLYGTPGLKSFATCGSGKIRAMRYALGYLWVLSDAALYRVDSTGKATLCTGDTIAASGTAMITDNGKQVVVLANGNSYTVGLINATFTFQVTGGTYSAGVNKISSITVNSVTITSGGQDWKSSNAQLASDIASNINAFASTPEYTASANNDMVTITASTAGTGPNGLAVAITVAGTVTTSVTSGVMGGGATNGTTVTQITSSGYPSAGASSVDYLDGYAIWSQAGSNQWFISALYDASTINALDFATAESSPSNILRVFVDHHEVWIFKPDTIEVWDDQGTSPFPFQKNASAVFERGCGAALSPAKIDNAVFWLGDDKIVYRSQGYTPMRISNHGIEDILRAATDVSDAFGMTYSQGGHAFYVLTCPTLGRTFAYDAATQSWHERQSGTGLVPAVWAVNCIVQAFNKIYGGTSAGVVGQLDLDTYTESGSAIRRVAVTPPFYNEGKRFIMPDLEVEAELGDGLSTGQGSDPTFMLRWSDDGGATWSNQRTQSGGLIGKRANRPIFRRLGMARQREVELSISDPVKVALYGLRFDATAMDS